MHLLGGRRDAKKLKKSATAVCDMYMLHMLKSDRNPLQDMRKVCCAKLNLRNGNKDIKPCIDMVTQSEKYRAEYSAYGNFDHKKQKHPVSHVSTDQSTHPAARKSNTVQHDPRQPNNGLPTRDNRGSNTGQHAIAKSMFGIPAGTGVQAPPIPLKHNYGPL